jgi:hypothetical protein
MSKMQIFATGVTITTGAASASASIPNCVNGTKPKYIRVAATAAAYVKMGATAVAGDILIQPGDSVVLAVAGAPTIAAIQVSAAGLVQVSPLEDS